MSEESPLPLPRPIAPPHEEARAAATAGPPPREAAEPAAAPPAGEMVEESPLAAQLPEWDLLPPAGLLARKRPVR